MIPKRIQIIIDEAQAMTIEKIELLLKDEMSEAEVQISHVKFNTAVDDLMISIARLILMAKENRSADEAKKMVLTISDATRVIVSYKVPKPGEPLSQMGKLDNKSDELPKDS
jgi:hypothetical protein